MSLHTYKHTNVKFPKNMQSKVFPKALNVQVKEREIKIYMKVS